MMSGTSLDGLDISYARYEKKGEQWKYTLLSYETYPYPLEIEDLISSIYNKSGLELTMADVQLGNFMGNQVKKFLKRYECAPDFIANHGHTIFHRPEIGFSTQIGHGPTIAALTGIPVIDDFRSLDVALGGQGAPLVPIGDRLLFGDYHYCLNLGGISNVSFENDGLRIAFDISACNTALNYLSKELNKTYDSNGDIASEGKLSRTLFDQLNELPYFKKSFPKSLGREWIEQYIFPILDDSEIRVKDKLCTVCHHIAYQISEAVKQAIPDEGKKGRRRMLVTGGGAHNRFLIEQINSYNPRLDITVPDKALIDFKEALVFGFLGTLRWRGEVNTLRSVTGASRDASSGVIHG